MAVIPATSRPVNLDVLVVGGGPAGCAAAIACRAANLSVAILQPDRGEADPTQPWETLHPNAVRLLHVLGVPEIVPFTAIGAVHRLKNNGLTRHFAGHRRAGWHIDRQRFDHEFFRYATSSGAHSIAGRLIGLASTSADIAAELSDGRLLRARRMIDASGRARTACRLLGGRQRRLSGALIARTGLEPRFDGRRRTATTFDSYAWGWCWQTAWHQGVRTWTALHSARADIPDLVRKLIANSVAGSVRTNIATWTSSDWDPTIPVVPVGDAAGAIDPASGLGITNALASGLAAARSVTLGLKYPQDRLIHQARYRSWWDQQLRLQAHELEQLYLKGGIDLAGPFQQPTTAERPGRRQA